MFNITPDLPGLAFDLELELNECQEPVYVLPNVTIPEVRQQTSEDPLPTCTKDLDQEACEAAGGKISSGINAAPYCICP
jgi:hypothetical protein